MNYHPHLSIYKNGRKKISTNKPPSGNTQTLKRTEAGREGLTQLDFIVMIMLICASTSSKKGLHDITKLGALLFRA